jgi:hypothetical protein
MENRHILYHMIDLRQTHIEQFNMLLILLIVTFDLISNSMMNLRFSIRRIFSSKFLSNY